MESKSRIELGDRKSSILQAVVEAYIETGEPIGSKLIASKFSVSSATVRNEMAELEESGFLEQPHTSAGRIPTHLGYRVYVDALMTRHNLSAEETEKLNNMLRVKAAELDRLITEANRIISEATNCASVMLSPRIKRETIKKFELVNIERGIIMCVAVTAGGAVQSRLIRVGEEPRQEELQALTALLNTHLAHKTIEAINLPVIHDIETEMGDCGVRLTDILSFVYDVLNKIDRGGIYTEGGFKLLDYPEYSDAGKVREFINFLSQEDQVRKLISPAEGEDGEEIRIRIGSENDADQMREATVIIGNYKIGGKTVGAVGIIGPTRINYSRMVSNIAYFTENMNKLLAAYFDETPGQRGQE